MRNATTPATVGVACCLALASTDAVQAEQRADAESDPKPSEAGGERKPAAKAAKIDPRADALLREMSTALTTAKNLQFDASHVQEIVTEDGQKLQFLARSRVQVQRPARLRSDRIGPIADLTLYYDGDDLTIHGKRMNLYATADAPPTLDEAIELARHELGIEAPGADLLYSDVYAGLMEDVVSGTYIGREPIGDRLCHHLAFRGKTTDWQIWIEDGATALPCRYVITSKDLPGSPQYSVELDSWKLAPIPASRFEFEPPPGATQIEFWTADHAKEQQQPKTKQERTP